MSSYTEYTAKGGESFDLLALRFYLDERLAHHIIGANPRHADVVLFAGGERLRIPELTETEKPDTLPPWRR